VQVLAGVVEVHDLGGLGEVLGSEVPDPGRAVAGEYELADARGTAAAGLSGHQDPGFRLEDERGSRTGRPSPSVLVWVAATARA
jgi:hypothetical protein